MDPIKRVSGVARILATVVASLLLLQVAFAGAPALVGGAAGAMCSTQQASRDQQQPAVPDQARDHSQCCVVQCGSGSAPPPNTNAALDAPAFAVARAAVEPAYVAPAARAEPKGAPQSPRAPPLAVPAALA
ncbi:hypothetical protein [Methylocystis echinoides]|uniref:hypothetical protein n=1 Tax=Methylocystis echinoides TaxID=29468 RepID=UPI00341795FC